MRTFSLLLLLVLAALAQEHGTTLLFTIHTEPEGASLSVRDRTGGVVGKYLGRSGSELSYTFYGNPESFHLVAQLEGFQDLDLTIPVADVQGSAHWPTDPHDRSKPGLPVPLTPNTFSTRVSTLVRRTPAVLLGPVGLVVGLVLTLKTRRVRRRNTVLEGFKQQARGSDDVRVRDVLCVGGWRLVRVLGKGGMATVYAAVPDDTLDEAAAVAIKIIDPELMKIPAFQQRFRREVMICSKLRHAHIVSLLDFGQQDELTYLVMEMVAGRTLRDLTRDGPPDRETALAWLEAVAGAVDYAHTLGVVHRDLKPDNVMVTESGRVKVMDFGLAKTEDAARLTETGDALGTPAYMAPEQINSNELDPRTDQYAVGVMGYEFLSGRLPFEDGNPVQLIFKHLQELPEPPGLSPEADAVLLRMLEKSPGERYNSVGEAIAELRRAF